jgi:hypothetical protein
MESTTVHARHRWIWAAAVLVSAGCSAAPAVVPAPPAPVATPAATPVATSVATSPAPVAPVVASDVEPVGPADTLPKEVAGGYGVVARSPGRLTDVRVAAHDGFDRIVLEFDGAEVPGYKIAYVPPPVTADASGAVVPVEGTAFLQLATAPAAGAPRERIAVPDGAAVRELVKIGDWEGTVTWAAGVDGERSFAVAELVQPTRLVVDVVR